MNITRIAILQIYCVLSLLCLIIVPVDTFWDVQYRPIWEVLRLKAVMVHRIFLELLGISFLAALAWISVPGDKHRDNDEVRKDV